MEEKSRRGMNPGREILEEEPCQKASGRHLEALSALGAFGASEVNFLL